MQADPVTALFYGFVYSATLTENEGSRSFLLRLTEKSIKTFL
jgi:hypothetical protein